MAIEESGGGIWLCKSAGRSVGTETVCVDQLPTDMEGVMSSRTVFLSSLIGLYCVLAIPSMLLHRQATVDWVITPREAMRLQSIPDDFELKYRRQGERNALIGNAVPPLMAGAIARSVRQALKNCH